MLSKAPYIVSSSLKTAVGSRAELHAVNPAISQNNTVQSGYKLATGTESSMVYGLSPLVPCSDTRKVFSVDFLSSVLARMDGRASRTDCGKSEDTTAVCSRAFFITSLCRRCTIQSYTRNAPVVKRKRITRKNTNSSGSLLMYSSSNAWVGYIRIPYSHRTSALASPPLVGSTWFMRFSLLSTIMLSYDLLCKSPTPINVEFTPST
mmetsp:Transcript_16014/g.32315  ORF Transcript_16014/g.32315 Transcript_16014/m.32315 type:complete len:206 (+) Transcript_16014:506-1123(+)